MTTNKSLKDLSRDQLGRKFIRKIDKAILLSNYLNGDECDLQFIDCEDRIRARHAAWLRGLEVAVAGFKAIHDELVSRGRDPRNMCKRDFFDERIAKAKAAQVATPTKTGW
jgi:hypothetical protein